MNPTIGSTCASLPGMDYRKLFACAFEGQYPEPYVKGLLLAAFQKSNRPKCQIGSTMFLDGEETIAWTSSAKLLGAICAAFTKNNPSVSTPAGCDAGRIASLKSSSQTQNTQCCRRPQIQILRVSCEYYDAAGVQAIETTRRS